MESSAREVVRQYHEAWTTGRVQEAMAWVHPDIVCRAPGAHLRGRDQYEAFIGAFAPAVVSVEEIAEFADGDRVARFYYPQTPGMPDRPAAECFRVEGGLIVENVLVFDRMDDD